MGEIVRAKKQCRYCGQQLLSVNLMRLTLSDIETFSSDKPAVVCRRCDKFTEMRSGSSR